MSDDFVAMIAEQAMTVRAEWLAETPDAATWSPEEEED